MLRGEREKLGVPLLPEVPHHLLEEVDSKAKE
jgi:hypothetical protein